MAAAATLAAVLHRVGSHSRAARLYQEVIIELTAQDGPESLRVLAAHADLATVEYARGQCTVARDRLQDAWELHREVYGDGHPSGIKMLARLGAMQRDCGQFAEAHDNLALARELCRQHLARRRPAGRAGGGAGPGGGQPRPRLRGDAPAAGRRGPAGGDARGAGGPGPTGRRGTADVARRAAAGRRPHPPCRAPRRPGATPTPRRLGGHDGVHRRPEWPTESRTATRGRAPTPRTADPGLPDDRVAWTGAATAGRARPTRGGTAGPPVDQGRARPAHPSDDDGSTAARAEPATGAARAAPQCGPDPSAVVRPVPATSRTDRGDPCTPAGRYTPSRLLPVPVHRPRRRAPPHRLVPVWWPAWPWCCWARRR